MNKRTLVLVALFFILAVQYLSPIFGQALSLLDFRTVTPVAPESPALSFTLPISTATAISFEYSDLVGNKTGNKIAADRITFSHNPRSTGGQDENFLATIRILPSDLPDEYEGVVYAVSQQTEEKVERFPFIIKVRVLPWIKIKPASSQSLLVIKDSPSLTASNLQASEPMKLLLAANAPWRLYLRVGNCPCCAPDKTPCFPLQIGIGKTIKTEDFSEILLPSGQHQLVAFGPPTVSGDGLALSNYWTELYVTASISNWRDWPTGVHTFAFIFYGETADH
jgi:hypothetical protein